MKINKYQTILNSFLTLGLLFTAGCQGLGPQATPTPEAPISVEAIPVVSATGIVRPARWATLSMSASGITAEVLVEQGQQVQAGQALVRLKGAEDLAAAISAARFEVQAAEKALDDLYQAAETASMTALQAIAIYARQVRDAQYALDNYTIPANQQSLNPWEAVSLMQERLDQARQAYEPVKARPSGDPTRQDLKQALDEAQSDYNAAIRRLELVTTLQVAQTNLAKAQRDYDLWKDGPDPKEVALAKARIENAQTGLKAAEARLKDLELLAPFTGTVSEVYVRQGEWVTMGQPILQIADLSHLRVETTDLNEIDLARVQVGDAVQISFDALPDLQISGLVASLSPKAAQGSGVNYTAVISLAEQPLALRWGMTAFVDIAIK